jgi:probable HAF family extracellular repeat protein
MGSGLRRFLAAAVSAASVGAHAIATEWTVVDLTPGAIGIANGISQNGIVVGCSVGAGETQAFVHSNGQTRFLPGPAGSKSCALVVNNDGVIAGRIDDEITIWDAAGVRGLGVKGNVTGISEAGAIVGAMQDGGTTPFGAPSTRAFLWANGVFTDLGVSGSAIGINNRGQVAVISSGKLFMWENGNLRDLGAATIVTARGFNDRGEIVGMTSFGHGSEPFIYDGVVRRIPGAFGDGGAVAINNVGQVLGSSEGLYGSLAEGGQAITLDKLAATASGSPLIGHHMEGLAINDRGWIVGQNGGDFHAFLLMPKATAPPTAAGANPALRMAEHTQPLIHWPRVP